MIMDVSHQVQDCPCRRRVFLAGFPKHTGLTDSHPSSLCQRADCLGEHGFNHTIHREGQFFHWYRPGIFIFFYPLFFQLLSVYIFGENCFIIFIVFVDPTPAKLCEYQVQQFNVHMKHSMLSHHPVFIGMVCLCGVVNDTFFVGLDIIFIAHHLVRFSDLHKPVK